MARRTRPSPSDWAADGRFHVSTTGRLTLSAAGNLRITFTNPANSQKLVTLGKVTAFATATSWGTILRNPDTNLPTSAARPTTNALLHAGTPPVAQLKADTDPLAALSGGIDTGLVVGSGAGQREPIELPPFFLVPGISLGVAVPFAGAADAVIAFYWVEDEL